MTMSNDRRMLYPYMNPTEIDAIDTAYECVETILKARGFRAVGDGRGENLVGAIARFLEDSKK